jgi:hypothetical protein
MELGNTRALADLCPKISLDIDATFDICEPKKGKNWVCIHAIRAASL